MSNLYYSYRGENAGQRSSTAPTHVPSASNDSLQLQQGVLIRTPAQPSIPFSNHQAWAPDQPTALQNHPQPQPPSSVNTSFQPSPQRSRHPLPMNATRPAIASQQTQYDDNFFPIMGKSFSDNTSRHQPASAPADQYMQLRPSQASNVFDPNDFPSLGGAPQNSSSVHQPHASTSVLSASAPSDSSVLGNVGLPSTGLNGLGHYADLYNMGAYGDGRGKAVDALTGASAAAEFNMQSEDFPALGGGPRASRAVNGTAGLGLSSAAITNASTLGKGPTADNIFDGQAPSVASSQAQSTLGRGQTHTSMLMGRSHHIANGYQLGGSPPTSSMLSIDRSSQPISLHPQRSVDELLPSSLPLRTPFPSSSQARRKNAVVESGMYDSDINPQARVEDPRSRHIPASHVSRLIPNGQSNISNMTLPNGPSANARANVPLPSRLAGSSHEDAKTSADVPLGASEKYGMKALLPIVLPMADGTGKAENMLSVGLDLTALGLNLNSSEPLHKTFDNPWDGGQAGPSSVDNSGTSPKGQEPAYKLPTCYYMQPPALRSSHFTKFQLETLFYIFYNMPRDVLQILAAVELYNRKWLYHKGLKLWFTCDTEANGSFENRGYIYFDIKSWEKRQFHEANQSFIQGLMTEDELNSVKIPPL